MKTPRIVIAGSHSGVGKTTVTLGLLAALKQRNLTVQGYKVGPDYIDGSYHTAVTGRVSRNLDSWMLGPEVVRQVFLHGVQGADVSIIEGVMGFFDGKDPLSNHGSTAEISLLLDCPVILVIDAAGMARSAAAVVKGFQMLDGSVRLAGVIANRVGGEGHYRLIRQAVESACGIPVVGYLSSEPQIQIPERHLGLVPAIERGEHDDLLQNLSRLVSDTVDLDRILEIASQAPPLDHESMNDRAPMFDHEPMNDRAPMFDHAPINDGLTTPEHPDSISVAGSHSGKVRIAIAKDSAFNFYYAENLELLEHYGAELVFFSPLHGEKLPEGIHGLYIGGGFPEEFAGTLSAYEAAMEDLRLRIRNGLPTYAECGGYMYLSESITDLEGKTHRMVGAIPASVGMQKQLSGFGYREVRGTTGNWLMSAEETARGHEFHYSSITYHATHPSAYEVTGYGGTRSEGYCTENVVAGYTHIHFASSPKLAARFVTRCSKFAQMKLNR